MLARKLRLMLATCTGLQKIAAACSIQDPVIYRGQELAVLGPGLRLYCSEAVGIDLKRLLATAASGKSGGIRMLPAHLPHIPKCVHATRDFVAKSRNVALQKTFLKFNSLHVSGIVSAMTLRGRLFRTASPDA